jgi:hypothetical protein
MKVNIKPPGCKNTSVIHGFFLGFVRDEKIKREKRNQEEKDAAELKTKKLLDVAERKAAAERKQKEKEENKAKKSQEKLTVSDLKLQCLTMF